MSLNWSIEEVENFEEKCFEQRYVAEAKQTQRMLKPVTNALVWSTMGVGIGEITEKNWRDFAYRLDLYQTLFGPLLSEVDDDGKAKPRPLTPLEVRDHIGLHTNVSIETFHRWLRRMVDDNHRRDFEQMVDGLLLREANEEQSTEPDAETIAASERKAGA